MTQIRNENVESELTRLKGLGWKDWPTSSFNYKSIENSEEHVSFPSNFWDVSHGNDDTDGLWAFVRALNISKLLSNYKINLIWEIGAGNGNAAIQLRKRGIDVICVEPLHSGAEILAKRNFCTYKGTIEKLNLPDGSISAIGLFDVLEHLEHPDDILKEIFRVLKPDGHLIITVPAHEWLFSNFDHTIGHFRRYSKKALQRKLNASQFKKLESYYFFSILVIPAFLIRRIPYLLKIKNFKLDKLESSNRTFFSILNFFKWLLLPLCKSEYYFKPPVGLSLISLSKKLPNSD
jgi:SAM-dependent methyltransferase